MKYWAPINSPGGINGNDGYVNGNPATGTEGSIPTFQSFEQTMRELVNLVTKNGLTPDSVLNGIQIAQSVQLGKINYALDTGTANALVVTLDPAPANLNAGLVIYVKKAATGTNTGAATISINGQSRNISRPNGAPLLAGDLIPNAILALASDGTNMQLVSFSGSTLPRTTKVTFTTVGANTFLSTVAGPHRFTLWGAGGGGGFGGSNAGGSGGSAGAFLEVTRILSAGQSCPLVVGGGGAAGTSGANGGAGTSTTATIAAETFTAGGGPGGLSNTSSGTSTNSPSFAVGAGAADRIIIAGQGDPAYIMTAPSAAGGRGGAAPLGGIGGVGGGGASSPGTAPGGAGGGSANSQVSAAGARGEIWVEF
jgi:hypothetical protein